MLDVDAFLIDLLETRRRLQSAPLIRTTRPANRCSIPPALDLILERGGLVQPQLAMSPSRRPRHVWVSLAETGASSSNGIPALAKARITCSTSKLPT